jgi:hypothetical protein
MVEEILSQSGHRDSEETEDEQTQASSTAVSGTLLPQECISLGQPLPKVTGFHLWVGKVGFTDLVLSFSPNSRLWGFWVFDFGFLILDVGWEDLGKCLSA